MPKFEDMGKQEPPDAARKVLFKEARWTAICSIL